MAASTEYSPAKSTDVTLDEHSYNLIKKLAEAKGFAIPTLLGNLIRQAYDRHSSHVINPNTDIECLD